MPSTSTPRFSPLAFVRRRKLATVTAVWALSIVVLAFVTPSVTVREQTTAAQALPQLDRAIGDVAGVLTGKPYAFDFSAVTYEGECFITPLRSGEKYARVLTVHTGDDDGRNVMADLFGKLKERYRLTVALAERPTYRGIDEGYVEFELYQTRQAVVWRAATGCRPPDDQVGNLSAAFAPKSQSVAVLERLGVAAPRWSSATAVCGDLAGPGGKTKTTEAVGELGDDVEADVSVAAEIAPEGAAITITSKKLVSYRMEGTSHTVELDDRTVTLRSTTDCSG